MSVWLPPQLLHQRNIQAGGEQSLTDAEVFRLRAPVRRTTTDRRETAEHLHDGGHGRVRTDARSHRAAVRVGTSAIPPGLLLASSGLSRFKVCSVCGPPSRSSTSPFEMHSRNVFFLNNRVDVFSPSLSVKVSLFIFIFFQTSMESSMHWSKMTF